MNYELTSPQLEKDVIDIEKYEYRIKMLEEELKDWKKKTTKLEIRIHDRINSLEKDIQKMLKEHNQNHDKSMSEIDKSLETITNMFNEHILMEKKEEIDRMKKRQNFLVVSVWGLVSAVLLMVIGTFWDMFIQPMIQMMNGGD